MHVQPRSQRVHVYLTGLALVAALPLVVPAISIAVHRPTIDWSGDRALTELAVREAARLHQSLGVGGRFGWRHPGPLWLQLLVPGYELSGEASWSLSVGVLAIHVACVVAAVLAVGRRGVGRWGAVLAAAIAAYVCNVGLVYWTNLWAGYAFTWPVLLLIVVGAVGATEPDADWAVPAALLTGTLLVQTDASTAVPVVVIGVVAFGLRLRRHGFDGGYRGWPSLPALVLYGLTVAAWIPPLIEWHNLTLLWSFAVHSSGGHPLRVAVAATGAALSVMPLGARWVLEQGVGAHLAGGPWWAVAWTVAFLVVNAGIAVWARRAGRPLAADLAVLATAGTIAGVLAISRVDGEINFYLLTWVSILPVATLAAAVIAFAPDTARTRHVTLAVAGVLVGFLLVRQGSVHNWDRRASADVMAMTGRVDATIGLAAHGLVDIHVVTADTWPEAAGVALQLERQGARIEVDRQWVFLFGDAFAPRPGKPTAQLWFARPHERPAISDRPGLVELGPVDGVDILASR